MALLMLPERWGNEALRGDLCLKGSFTSRRLVFAAVYSRVRCTRCRNPDLRRVPVYKDCRLTACKDRIGAMVMEEVKSKAVGAIGR